MKKILSCFALLAKGLVSIALILTCTRQVSAQTPGYVQTFDNYFNNNLSAYQNKVVAVIGCPEGILYSYSNGYNAESMISVQSISKWLTSAVIMTLVEENKFSLDDKVGQYISSWNANGKQDVTIRQILAHTSGIVDGTQWDSSSSVTLEQAVNNIATNTNLMFTPGSDFEYGSTSYKVASRVAEVVEGKPWKTIFSERMASVCGMGTSVYSPNSIDNPATGRGLLTSLTQYSNFLRMILRHGMHNSTRVMDSTSIVAMEAESSYDGVPFVTYGLGLWREGVDGNGVAKELMHPGVDGALAWIDRNKGYFGLIITSAGMDATYSISQTFRQMAKDNIPNNSCGSVTPPVENPCNFIDKETRGTWTANNFGLQTRLFTVNGNPQWLIVTVEPGTTTDKHFPRGANFVDRTDLSWNNGTPSKSCLGSETAWGGLSIPDNIATPAGYVRATTQDGAVYFEQVTCTPPSAPTLSASPATINSGSSSTLSASGCSGGTITWSDGLGTGTSKTVSPTTTKTYSATCTISGCTSTAANVTITVNTSGGPDCNNVQGFFDGASCDYLNGWAYDASAPNTVVNVDIYDGGTLIAGNISAGVFRQDLVDAGKGNGYHGFSIPVPSSLKNGASHNLTIKITGCSSFSLFNSPRTIAGCSGGCTTPSAPTLSASPSTITTSGGSSTLSASGCSGGTITWSDALGTGTSKSVTPTSTKTYTATCSIDGCTSSNASVTVTVDIPSSGVNCNTISSDVNGANCFFIEGWIFDSSNPNTPVSIDIYDGSTLIISNYSANKYRSDLSGMGNGNHAFEINTPSSLRDGQSHTLHFKASGCNYTLNNSPRVLSSCSNSVVDMTGADDMLRKTPLTIMPNPNKGIFKTDFYLEKGKKAEIIITDMQGRTIYRQSVIGQGLHKQQINLLNKASGTLLFRLQRDNGVEVKKINIAR